jgi:hypothetical protein
MLEEIRSFFREVREEPAPTWPDCLSKIDPAERDLRVESELNWRLMMEARYDLEFKIVDLYDTRADVPAAIDLINEVIAIIRRNGEPRDARFREIWCLMQNSGAPVRHAISARPRQHCAPCAGADRTKNRNRQRLAAHARWLRW